MKSFLIKVLAVGLLCGFSTSGFAEKASAPPPSLASSAQKPLEVKGQTRSVNFMMVNQGDRNQISFVKVRRNYKEKIPQTKY